MDHRDAEIAELKASLAYSRQNIRLFSDRVDYLQTRLSEHGLGLGFSPEFLHNEDVFGHGYPDNWAVKYFNPEDRV